MTKPSPLSKPPAADAESAVADKQQWYSGLLGLAQERGHSEGWAAHRFKEKFGEWPKGLHTQPATPTRAVINFDNHCRIKFVKAKAGAT